MRTGGGQGMSLRQRGFSLLEVLIAMSLSSALLLGASRFLPGLQSAILRQNSGQALEDEVWQRVYAIAKQLQRAGFCRGNCQGAPLIISQRGQCVIVQWDANGNGTWERAPARQAEQTGFRLRDNALETLRGATRCEGKGWEKMTDPATIRIHDFRVTMKRMAGYAPQLTIVLSASAVRMNGPSVSVRYDVTGFNL